jgi:hypothetical protein
MKAYILEGFGFRLAFLSFLLLGVAGPAHAGQSGAPPPSTNTAAPAVAPGAAAPSAKLATQAGQTAAAAAPAAKGNQEGIKVHGHWTIDVKNPDGTLVTHREFENGLYSDGVKLLPAILDGAVTPGSWLVLLSDASQADILIIAQAASAASAACPGRLNAIAGTGRVGSCSYTLQVAGPSLATAGTIAGGLTGSTLTFTGSGTVPLGFAAAIGSVETDNFPCLPSDTLTACFSDANSKDFTLTFRDLDGLSGDPAAVPVSAGQTVAVTVVISFQ